MPAQGPYTPPLPQPRNACRIHPQIGQDLIRVFTHQRRRTAVLHRGLRQSDRAGHQLHLAGLGVRHLHSQATGLHSSPAAIDPHVILIHHDVSRFIMMATCMNTPVREKFSSQAAPEVLAALRQIAEAEGRQFQSILDEALRDYIDRRQKERPRRHVMSAFAASLDEFDALYRELAK